MTRLVDLNLQPGLRTLRQFGFIALFGFGALALLAFAEVGPFRFGLGSARVPVMTALVAVGLLAGGCSLIYPRANWPLYAGLSLLFFPVGVVVSYALLSALFVLVIGPLSLLIRVFAADTMRRRYDERAESYWFELEPERPKKSYFRQF